jgi:hypothetical protein
MESTAMRMTAAGQANSEWDCAIGAAINDVIVTAFLAPAMAECVWPYDGMWAQATSYLNIAIKKNRRK